MPEDSQGTNSAVRPQRIHFKLSGQYKSIGTLSWRNVPPLAVITGINGSGKTQLLEALFLGLAKRMPPNTTAPGAAIEAKVEGASIGPNEVALFRQGGDVGDLPVTSFPAFKSEARQFLDKLKRGNVDAGQSWVREGMKDLTTTSLAQLGEDEFLEIIEAHPEVLLHRDRVLDGLSDIFMSYRTSSLKAWDRGVLRERLEDELGPPPWDILNRILEEARFPYRATSPDSVHPLADFTLGLVSTSEPGLEIRISDLSAGERVILSTIMWMFRSRHQRSLPRLLLLDEPDAHLHPSLARQFLDVIQNVLVEEYGVRVVMTTHSPSTVALAPEGSLFEMQRTGTRIRESPSRWHSAGLLTAGLLTVGPSTKYVFVEDKSDQEFYECVFRTLTRQSPFSEDSSALSVSPSLVFIPASEGQKSGGSGRVRKWLNTFEGSHTHGLLDGDGATNQESDDRLHRLGRYEIENYLADPLIVFAALAGLRCHPRIKGIRMEFGQEHTLMTKNRQQLQSVIDRIGSTPLFPCGDDLQKAMSRHMAARWLRTAEKLAELEPQNGSLWHAYRRKWATERKHLPDVDVAEAGGWKTVETLKTAYQHSDPETMLRVVLEPAKLREVR